MVELFTSLFVELVKGNKTNDADVARKFIDEQIEIYEKKLQDAEARLKEFRLRNMVMNPGSERDYFTRMHDASAQLSQAELELREAENSRNALRDQLAREMALEERKNTLEAEAVPGGSDSVPEIDARIDAMQRTLDVLLQKFTDEHPDVIGTRRVIRELAQQRRELLAARKKEGVPAALALAPVRGPNAFEQLKVSLAQAEANVASLRTRVAEYTERYNRLKQAASAVPQLDAEFAQLNRDYDVNKKNYESLIARRESASLSSDMQAVAGVGDFRVIDPPHVSPRPVAPNRLLLLPLALVLALGAGVAATFVAMQARPTFYDGKTLRAVTSLPVLGAISMLPSRTRTRAKISRAVGFLTGLGALVGAYAAGFAALMVLTVKVV
jgi:polysaccharide chain length determinant protein (PEP-CTERM system associated)